MRLLIAWILFAAWAALCVMGVLRHPAPETSTNIGTISVLILIGAIPLMILISKGRLDDPEKDDEYDRRR